MKDWITQVAEATGKSPQSVRLAIQNGWEIGAAIQLADSKRFEYFPHPQKIKELIGIDIGGEHGRTHSSNGCSNCDTCSHSTSR